MPEKEITYSVEFDMTIHVNGSPAVVADELREVIAEAMRAHFGILPQHGVTVAYREKRN